MLIFGYVMELMIVGLVKELGATEKTEITDPCYTHVPLQYPSKTSEPEVFFTFEWGIGIEHW